MVRQTGVINENARLLESRDREAAGTNRLLAAANARLSEADRLKTAFLATISHEMQTPITSIRGFSALLERGGSLGGQADDYVGRIARNADALARLVTDLVEFSRLERGEVPLTVEPVLLSSLVPRVVDQLAMVAHGHRVRLEVQSDVNVLADPGAVTRILTNLFSNAVKFSPVGTEIEMRVTADSTMAMLHVADHGPGIEERDKDQVFDLFHRGSEQDQPRTPGMGIGLAVVRELTERMDGCVAVGNREEGGAEFCVRLPLDRAAPST